MQAEEIQQQNPQMDVERPLFQTQPDLRLGYIVFNTNRKPLNKDAQSALKYVSGFYSKQYVEKSVTKKIIQKKNSPYKIEEIQEINKDLLSHFPLQSVFDYHVHLVSSTLQPFFNLQNADFKIRKNNPIKNLRQQVFWSINFLQLKCMNLSNSDLFNIEGLIYCNLPVLQKLQLQANHITSITPLVKCNFHDLKQISLYKNPLYEMKKILRLKCSNMKQIQIDVETQTRFGGQIMIRNRRNREQLRYPEQIDFMIKLECISNMKQMPMKFLYRLQPRWHSQKMKQINPNLKIYTKCQERRRRQERQHQRQLMDQEYFRIIGLQDAFVHIEGGMQEMLNQRQQLIRLRNQRRVLNNLRRAQQRRQQRHQR